MPDIFLYQGQPNPSDVKLTDPTQLSGQAAISGTADITSPASSIAVTGADTFTGTAALTSPASAIAATSTEAFSGTLSLTSPASSIAATAAGTFTATAALTIPASAIDATGSLTFTAIAALESPASSIAAGDIVGELAIESPASGIDAQGLGGPDTVVPGRTTEGFWYWYQLPPQKTSLAIVGTCRITSTRSRISARGTVIVEYEEDVMVGALLLV